MTQNEYSVKPVKTIYERVCDKIREEGSEKVKFLEAHSFSPQFIGKPNPEMHLAEDGTKCCFMFNERESAKRFASCLSEQLGVKFDVDSFIGYATVYVPAEHYEEAIQKGVNNLLITQNGFWMDFYNERKCFDYEPILALTPHSSCYDKNGKLKKGEEVVIRGWIWSLGRILGEEILYDRNFSSVIEIGIRRKPDAHLTHEDVLDKIRQTTKLKKSPFDGYAFIDYYGKYIK